MTIEKLDPVFADTGSKDTDTTFGTWAGAGWVDERVRYKGINKQFNRQDEKINEAIDRLPKALPEDEDELPYIKGLFTPSNDFSNAAADLNVFDLSGDLDGDIHDFCYCKIDGIRKILLVDGNSSDDNPVKIFDIVAGSVTGCGDLSSDLSAPTTSWDALSICCDEDYCYILFRDVGPTPDEFRVQSWALDDWTVNTGWPATGLALTAGSVAVDEEQVRIRNASDSKLVVTQPWVAVATGASAGLNIISKADGTSDGTGAGNCGSVTNGQVSGVCSDGTTVFFSLEEAAQVSICGMTIASPGANGPSGIHWPEVVSADPEEFGGIACCGNFIVATWADGTLIFSSHGTSCGTVAKYSTADTDKCEVLGPVCFDGKNFWSLGERVVYTATSRSHIFKISGAQRGGYNISGDPYIETVSDGELFVEAHTTIDGNQPQDSDHDIDDYQAGGIMSDGRDIWFYNGDANNNGQTLYRFSKSLIR